MSYTVSYTVEVAATHLGVTEDTIATLAGLINDDPDLYDYETGTITEAGLGVIRAQLASAPCDTCENGCNCTREMTTCGHRGCWGTGPDEMHDTCPHAAASRARLRERVAALYHTVLYPAV